MPLLAKSAPREIKSGSLLVPADLASATGICLRKARMITIVFAQQLNRELSVIGRCLRIGRFFIAIFPKTHIIITEHAAAEDTKGRLIDLDLANELGSVPSKTSYYTSTMQFMAIEDQDISDASKILGHKIISNQQPRKATKTHQKTAKATKRH